MKEPNLRTPSALAVGVCQKLPSKRQMYDLRTAAQQYSGRRTMIKRYNLSKVKAERFLVACGNCVCTAEELDLCARVASLPTIACKEYNYLIHMRDRFKWVFPSLNHIGSYLQSSRRYVCMINKRLEKAGLISIQREKSTNVYRDHPNIYTHKNENLLKDPQVRKILSKFLPALVGLSVIMLWSLPLKTHPNSHYLENFTLVNLNYNIYIFKVSNITCNTNITTIHSPPGLEGISNNQEIQQGGSSMITKRIGYRVLTDIKQDIIKFLNPSDRLSIEIEKYHLSVLRKAAYCLKRALANDKVFEIPALTFISYCKYFSQKDDIPINHQKTLFLKEAYTILDSEPWTTEPIQLSHLKACFAVEEQKRKAVKDEKVQQKQRYQELKQRKDLQEIRNSKKNIKSSYQRFQSCNVYIPRNIDIDPEEEIRKAAENDTTNNPYLAMMAENLSPKESP